MRGAAHICSANGQATWNVVYGEVTRVILMYVDTVDCYKVRQSGASIGKQAR